MTGNTPDLDSMNRTDLRTHAKGLGLNGFWNMGVGALRELIRAQDGPKDSLLDLLRHRIGPSYFEEEETPDARPGHPSNQPINDTALVMIEKISPGLSQMIIDREDVRMIVKPVKLKLKVLNESVNESLTSLAAGCVGYKQGEHSYDTQCIVRKMRGLTTKQCHYCILHMDYYRPKDPQLAFKAGFITSEG